MGIVAAADAATKSSSSSLTFPILIVLVFVGFYFLMIRPQRRRQQQVAQQQKTIAPGSLVRTTAGMYATVVAVEDNDVILEVAPGVEVRFLRRAIMEVVTPAEEETFEDGENFEATDEAFEDDEPASAADDETPGTLNTVSGVGSGDEVLARAHDGEPAKADTDNVH
ncbi:MAG: preprotein translocase subunit YajC [Actinomycetota bacterium]|nr:preprotein translocase subunit YajC [Actinomycetota bacterium]